MEFEPPPLARYANALLIAPHDKQTVAMINV